MAKNKDEYKAFNYLYKIGLYYKNSKFKEKFKCKFSKIT